MRTPQNLPQELDQAIQHAKRAATAPSTDDAALRQSISTAIARALAHPHIATTTTGGPGVATQVLTQLSSPGSRPNPLLATALLRMLVVPSLGWLHDPPWRAPVLHFIEACFADDVYQSPQYTKVQSYEKLRRLYQLVIDKEDQFTKALKLASLAKSKNHQQTLMRALKSGLGNRLIVPFLPPDIEATLTAFYDGLISYLHSDDTHAFDAWNAAIAGTHSFVQSCSDSGIGYRDSLAAFGQHVEQLLRQDFARNPKAQPTSLDIRPPLKKYPLREAGRAFYVDFVVENSGQGYARDVVLLVEARDDVTLPKDSIELGTLQPSSRRRVKLDAQVSQAVETTDLVVLASWRDFGGTSRDRTVSLPLYSQRKDLDWAALEAQEPYSLEPVNDESELIGRQKSLKKLVAKVKARNAGSAIVKGQKRVGKSSLAKALKSHLEKAGHVAIYIESGDYITPDASNTIASLGGKLVRRLRGARQVLERVPRPDFDDALAPFADYLDDCLKLIPDTHVVIILDEFDQLPAALYKPADIGNAFFESLRSLASREQVSVILVGSEKMEHIIEWQGHRMNKWLTIPVDYFDRSGDWADYQALVRTPVQDSIEYNDDAIEALYEQSAGNPYFTNLICSYVFRKAVELRDCHVTRDEITRAVTFVSEDAEAISFSHFWIDGIRESGQLHEESIRRRKVLVAVSGAMKQGAVANSASIGEEETVRRMGGVDLELSQFVRRNVLEQREGGYGFKVPLFGRWLRERGALDLMAQYMDTEAVETLRQRTDAERIGDQEMVRLLSTWGTYKGQAITADDVRGWLEQFDSADERRAMFTVLQGLRFVSHAVVREKLREVGVMVGEPVQGPRAGRGRKHRKTLVSYLDGVGKSGAEFAKLYASEMAIYVDNVVEKGRLAEKLMASRSVDRVVFVDDLVGTGDSVISQLEKLHPQLVKVLQAQKVAVHYAVVLAFERGWRRLEAAVDRLAFEVDLQYCELIQDADQAFGVRPGHFDTQEDANRAREVALKYGNRLTKAWPLGYGACELAVVFERSCPNNTLPILWQESSEPRWTSLFSR